MSAVVCFGDLGIESKVPSNITLKTIKALVHAIETTDVTNVDERIVRRNAVESLGRLKATSALETICICLQDDDKYTAENEVWAIGEIGTTVPHQWNLY